MFDAAAPSRRKAGPRVIAVVASVSVLPAVVLGLLGLLAGPVVAAVAFVVAGAGAAVLLWWSSEALVAYRIGGRAPDAVADARFVNLVEGLCTAAGVHQPLLRVLEDPAINALAAGWRPGRAVLAVTEGALQHLSRIELEAVLADEVMRIRRGDTVAPTLSAAAFRLVDKLAWQRDDDIGSDQAAVSLTRYPPGLVSAFDKMESAGVAVGSARRSLGHLWLAEAEDGRARLALAERIEALLEL